MKTILLADDHPLILSSVSELIQSAYPDVEILSATNWSEVLSNVELKIDLFILDLEMPAGGAQNVISKINTYYPKSKIIVLTMHSHSWVFQSLSQQKIEGFVSKLSNPEEIIQAIQLLGTDETFLCPEFKRVYLNKKCISCDSYQLTKRETEILNLILETRSTKEIASYLSVSENTVETHRKNLFLKFEVKNVVALVLKAINSGFSGKNL
jgi:DNA-binding NarL/FixJ family response regulator